MQIIFISKGYSWLFRSTAEEDQYNSKDGTLSGTVLNWRPRNLTCQ